MSTFDENSRIKFHPDLEIMEVDFSDFTFSDSSEVNTVYDSIERLVAETKRKWYFMVNYRGTKIDSEAWFQFAARGKDINIASSLGSVRFDPREPTRAEIMKRAEKEDFNPNLVSTRDEAIERILVMKRESAVT